jgi:hypothetical protein
MSTYVAEQLDQVDLDGILKEIRDALRGGRLDQHPAEVAYLDWIRSLTDFPTYRAERDRVYRAYDDCCDRLIPLLQRADGQSPKLALELLGPPFIELFYLDGKRRGVGGAFNERGSVARHNEEAFTRFIVARAVGVEDTEELARRIIVNILAPELPFDVQSTRDMLLTMQQLGLTEPEDFALATITERVRHQRTELNDLIELYARGSAVTFARKLSKYEAMRTRSVEFLCRLDERLVAAVAEREAAVETVRAALSDPADHDELSRHLGTLRDIAVCNGIEDVRRRVALDRFEEYLLRVAVADAMHELGLLESSKIADLDHARLAAAVEAYLGRNS